MTLVIVKYLLLPAAGACVAWFVAQRLDVGRWELRLAGRARRLVSGLTVLVAGVFATLLVARYLTWHSFILDLGSYDQKVWLIATRPDLGAMLEQTYRGGVRVMPCGSMRYWGICHFQPLYVLYGLAYRVWASPLVLLLSQVLLIVSGAVPCYLLARARLESSAAGVLACALYFLHPAVQFNGLVDFRPDHIAIPFLFLAYWLLERGRVLPAIGAAAVPALAKQSLLLAFAFFGLYVAWRRRRPVTGLAMFATGLTAFGVVSFYVLGAPGRSEGAFMIARYFSGAALLDPQLVARKIVYLIALLGPLGFLPIGSPAALLPAIPSLLASLVASDPNFASITSQYSASTIAPAFAAMFVALPPVERRLRRRGAPLRILIGLVVLSTFFTVAQGPTPLSLGFWSSTWGRQWHYSQYLPDRQEALDAAAELIPTDPDVMVVSQNDANSARLAHRHFYFPFPNGLERADFVLLDLRRWPWIYWVPDPDRYAEIVRRLRESADYHVVFEHEGVLLFGRVGAHNPGPPDLRVAPPLPVRVPR